MRKYRLLTVLLVSLLLGGFSAQAVSGEGLPADWTEVEDLQEGSLLKTESGWVVIEDIEYLSEPGTFYNLSVTGPNSDFFANGFLAHNKGESSKWVVGRVWDNSGRLWQRLAPWGPWCGSQYMTDTTNALDVCNEFGQCASLGMGGPAPSDALGGWACNPEPYYWVRAEDNGRYDHIFYLTPPPGWMCDYWCISYPFWKPDGNNSVCGAGCATVAGTGSPNGTYYGPQGIPLGSGDWDNHLHWHIKPARFSVTGYVWDDTNEQNCVFNAGTESKMGGQTVHLVGDSWSGSFATCEADDPTCAHGSYSFSNVPQGIYDIRVEPEDEWGMYCPDTGSYGPFALNANTVINLGVRNEPPSWIQATNGDVYSAAGVVSRVPGTVHPDYEQFFISANPDSAGGVCTAKGGINTNNRTSERGDDNGWSAESYGGGIPWPDIISEISQSSGILYYLGTDLVIGDSFNPFRPEIAPFNLFQGKIVLVNGDIYIDSSLGGSAETLNAILIARGKITIIDSAGDNPFKVSGGLYARDGIFNNRELDNKRIPAVSAIFDPSLFLNAPEALKEPRIIWREVAP